VAPGPRPRAGHGRSPVQLGRLAPSGLSPAIGTEAAEGANMKNFAPKG
jgi:hypothetical protein